MIYTFTLAENALSKKILIITETKPDCMEGRELYFSGLCSLDGPGVAPRDGGLWRSGK
jgi:hypothetical protein